MLMQIVLSFVFFAGFASTQLVNDPLCGQKGQHPGDLPRIIGGDDAAPYEFPWQGALLKDGVLRCGASILNNRWLITGAQCVFVNGDQRYPEDLSRFTFVAGSTIYKNDKGQPRTIAHIEKPYSHPNYGIYGNPTLPINDIALLKLKETLPLSLPSLAPICLPEEPTPDDLDSLGGTACITTGWGETTYNGFIANILQRVSISVWEQTDCQEAYYKNNYVKVERTMICAAGPGKDSCVGDNGGPLISYSDSHRRWYLWGLTSWGFDCANPNFPGVYTRVTEFMPWIKDTMEKNS